MIRTIRRVGFVRPEREDHMHESLVKLWVCRRRIELRTLDAGMQEIVQVAYAKLKEDAKKVGEKDPEVAGILKLIDIADDTTLLYGQRARTEFMLTQLFPENLYKVLGDLVSVFFRHEVTDSLDSPETAITFLEWNHRDKELVGYSAEAAMVANEFITGSATHFLMTEIERLVHELYPDKTVTWGQYTGSFRQKAAQS